MKRIDLNAIKVKRIKAFVVFGLCMALFFVVLIVPLFSTEGEYENLLEKEIEVSDFRVEYRPKFSKYSHGHYVYRLITTDGEVYSLSGDFDYDEVVETLTKGTKATIKWYKGAFLASRDFAEVVTVDGKEVVSYDNDDVISWWGYLIVSLVAVSVGLVTLLIYLSHLKHLKIKQEKRDKRIEKKYGKKQYEEK